MVRYFVILFLLIPTLAWGQKIDGKFISGTLDPSTLPLGLSTTPSAGQILIGNAGGTAYAPQTMSGSCTITSAGVTSCSGGGGSTNNPTSFLTSLGTHAEVDVGSGSSINCAAPSGITTNGLIFQHVRWGSNSITFSSVTGGGWTNATGTVTIGSQREAVFYHIATGGETSGTTWTFNFSGSTSLDCIASGFAGANTSTPLESNLGSLQSSSSTSGPIFWMSAAGASANSITPLYFGFVQSASATTITLPGTFYSITDSNNITWVLMQGYPIPSVTAASTIGATVSGGITSGSPNWVLQTLLVEHP